jgi:hypothetical protein
MKNTTKHIIVLSAIICLLNGCKKDKLTNDYNVLVGTWTTISSMGEVGNCGFVIGTQTNPNLKLTLIEKGRYKLYSGDKKIESGRLIIKNGLMTFEDIERNSTLSGTTILKFNSDTLNIDRNPCDDDYVFRFVKN